MNYSSDGVFVNLEEQNAERRKQENRATRCACGQKRIRRGGGAVCPTTGDARDCVVPKGTGIVLELSRAFTGH